MLGEGAREGLVLQAGAQRQDRHRGEREPSHPPAAERQRRPDRDECLRDVHGMSQVAIWSTRDQLRPGPGSHERRERVAERPACEPVANDPDREQQQAGCPSPLASTQDQGLERGTEQQPIEDRVMERDEAKRLVLPRVQRRPRPRVRGCDADEQDHQEHAIGKPPDHGSSDSSATGAASTARIARKTWTLATATIAIPTSRAHASSAVGVRRLRTNAARPERSMTTSPRRLNGACNQDAVSGQSIWMPSGGTASTVTQSTRRWLPYAAAARAAHQPGRGGAGAPAPSRGPLPPPQRAIAHAATVTSTAAPRVCVTPR